MAKLEHISVFSAFRIGFIIDAVLGAIAGVFCSAAAFAGLHVAAHPTMTGGLALLPVVVCPLLWGVVGGIGAAITALLYNLGARWLGGLEVEIR